MCWNSRSESVVLQLIPLVNLIWSLPQFRCTCIKHVMLFATCVLFHLWNWIDCTEDRERRECMSGGNTEPQLTPPTSVLSVGGSFVIVIIIVIIIIIIFIYFFFYFFLFFFLLKRRQSSIIFVTIKGFKPPTPPPLFFCFGFLLLFLLLLLLFVCFVFETSYW